jgi:hypothetical protein
MKETFIFSREGDIFFKGKRMQNKTSIKRKKETVIVMTTFKKI